MGIVALIVVGLIAGLLAKIAMPGPDPGGIVLSIIVGVIGAFVGGFVLDGLLGNTGVLIFSLPSVLVATFGSIILLTIYRLIARRSA